MTIDETENKAVASRPKTVERIVNEQIDESLQEYKRSNKALFLSAVTAGLDLGFSLLVIGVLHTMFNSKLSGESMRVLLAAAYPIGFIFVILGRSALFTEHTTLAVLPVLDRKETIPHLARLWAIIYAGNLVGGYIIGGAIAMLGPKMGLVTEHALEDIAHHLVDHTGWVILVSAILAGWLMGLVSWLVTSSQETISRILVVILVTAVIGLGSLHHCIVGSTEVFAAMLVSETVSLADYLVTQGWSTVGNMIGGVFFVSILKFQVVEK